MRISGWSSDVCSSDLAVLRSMRPTDQIAVQVARGAAAGQQSISIALRPTELGEVSVRIDLADGNAKVRVEVERPETLKLVQTDARHLERALSEAGIRDRKSTRLHSSH